MFTGIVQGTAPLISIEEKQDFRTHTIALPSDYADALVPGASVAHNGCCLTVTAVAGDNVSFDLMKETLAVTNLGSLVLGDRVNFERAAKIGDEIGGHQMSGHIMCQAKITQIIESENNREVWFSLPEQFERYIFAKGYIGIDGISLTIGTVRDSSFNVNLIPETISRTNMAFRRQGDKINIEVDPQTQAIVDTVERVLESRTVG